MKQAEKSPTDDSFEFDDVRVLNYVRVACVTIKVYLENHTLWKAMLVISAANDCLWDDCSSNNVAVH